jgi:tetratricopeptide (TPR) repeat protein
MSYIHEALIKAQKERNSHYPKDPVHVAQTVGLTTPISWAILTLLLMLITILIAIIVYSWLKTSQTEQLSHIEKENQTKSVIVNPVPAMIESERTNQKIKKKTVVRTEENSLKQFQASIRIQPEMKQQPELKETDAIITDNVDTELSVDNEPDVETQQIIGPGQFLEVSRFYDKGLQYQVKKKYELAITCYKKCLEISPHMAPALNNMGVILLKIKDYQQAKTYFLTAIKESPDYVDPYYNLACLFSQIKNAQQAIDYLKKAVNISDEARNWAITDLDFEPLYELKEFNMIISGY